MRKIAIFLIILAAAPMSKAQDVTARLDTLLKTYTALNKFNGTVLIAQHGKVLLNKGYGYRTAATGVQHDPGSVFQIGSVTKQFTAAVILKLQTAGKLNVQDHISKYFPGYPKGDSITVEQLMLHTSGIYSYTNDRSFMSNEVAKPSNKEKMMALFKDKPLDFSPGTDWKYSNSGYSLLGYIIESVTKKPYEQVVREYLFTPLKMSHSGFDYTHLQSKEKSTGYFALNEKDTVLAPIVDSSVAFSAGSIYSTTGDIYRWHQGLQKNIILTKAQQEQAYTPVKHKYGYGWGIDTLYGKRTLAHSGGIHGFTSNFSRIPEDDACVILLCNTSSPELGKITKNIYAILYNQPVDMPKVRASINLPEAKLQEYTGTYTITPQLQMVVTVKEGKLLGSPTGQPSAILQAEKEDLFFVTVPEVQFKFTRDEKQAINGFVLYQNGMEIKCPKIK
jgi:CubicO group peptidase (beta-lactamase class C family)